jgi:hypothetical protein
MGLIFDISAWRASNAARELSNQQRIKLLLELSQTPMDSDSALRVQRLLEEEVQKMDPEWRLQQDAEFHKRILLVLAATVAAFLICGFIASAPFVALEIIFVIVVIGIAVWVVCDEGSKLAG